MSFLTWAALAIAALVAAPVLAHLLRRRPPEEHEFAAAELVPPTTAVAQRRTALEDRALFGIRALCIVALAILGATPLLRCSRLSLARPSGASMAVVIVVDDSLSMRAPLRGEGAKAGMTRFDRAKQAAEELLASTEQGDAVALVLAGRPARVALAATTNLKAAAAAVGELRPSDRGTDLEAAVGIAGELLADLAHVDKRVVVLADRLAEAGEPLAAPSGVKLWAPLEELAAPLDDCGVVRADRSGPQVAVTLACSPAPPGPDAGAHPRRRRVAIVAGAKVLVDTPVDLDRPSERVLLTLPPKVDAGARLHAELQGPDDIAADDAAPVVAEGGELRVAIVSDATEGRVATGGPPVVEQAIDALQVSAVVQPLPSVPDRAADLEPIGLLVVDDVPGFTPSQRRELSGWVAKGGVMLLALGPRAAAAPLGSGFAPLVPAIVRYKDNPAKGVLRQGDRLFGGVLSGLDDLGAKKRTLLELDAPDAVTVVSRWSDEVPLAVERRIGRGVVHAVTLPFSPKESDLPLRPGFLALLDRSVRTARALGGTSRSTVGYPWRLDGFAKVEVEQHGSAGRPLPLGVEQLSGEARRVVPREIGLYRLQLDDTVSWRAAAMDENELGHGPRAIANAPGQGELGSVDSTVDVSKEVALALLLLMLAELALRVAGPRLRPRTGAS